MNIEQFHPLIALYKNITICRNHAVLLSLSQGHKRRRNYYGHLKTHFDLLCLFIFPNNIYDFTFTWLNKNIKLIFFEPIMSRSRNQSQKGYSTILADSHERRVAAKIFVFVISRNFREIFNFVFREIFLEFRIKIWAKFYAISRNTKPKLGALFCYFGRIEHTHM